MGHEDRGNWGQLTNIKLGDSFKRHHAVRSLLHECSPWVRGTERCHRSNLTFERALSSAARQPNRSQSSSLLHFR